MSARNFLLKHRLALTLAVVGCLLLTGLGFMAMRMRSNRPGPGAVSADGPAQPSSGALPDFAVKPISTLEGDAKWYEVPANSLAQRRAWPGELTAASDRLPQETYVRVRRIDREADPLKTVVVRITDNGVHNRSTLIDLDRPAAEALGMVRVGQARVRVEVLALENATTDKPVEKKSGSPTAPKTSDLTNQPAASEKQEEAAASDKP